MSSGRPLRLLEAEADFDIVLLADFEELFEECASAVEGTAFDDVDGTFAGSSSCPSPDLERKVVALEDLLLFLLNLKRDGSFGDNGDLGALPPSFSPTFR